MNEYILKIVTDIHCEVYIDQVFITIAPKGIMIKVPLTEGEYLINLKNTVNYHYEVEQIVHMKYDRVISVNFKELARQHPEWIQETDYRIDYHNNENIVNIITGDIFATRDEYHANSGIVFNEGLARVTNKKHKWGYINLHKKEVVPCIYDYATLFSEGIGGVQDEVNEICLFFDQSGNLLFKKPMRYIGECNDGYIIGYDSQGSVLIDRNGEERRLAMPCLEIEDYSDGRIIVQEPDDEEGNSNKLLYDIDSLCMIGRRGWENISPFSEGLAVVRLQYEYTYINRNADYAVAIGFKHAKRFSEGLAAVVKFNNDKYGFINIEGKDIIPSIYDDAGSFSEGLAWVKQNGKCGYINKEGSIMIDYLYDSAFDFHGGLAEVCLQEEIFYIDKYGNIY